MKHLRRIFQVSKKNEDGAIVMEASISLTTFMFLIISLLTLVNLSIAQAKIGIALNQTAQEISQYFYFYSLSGLNEIQAKEYEATGETRDDLVNVEENVVTALTALKDFGSGEEGFQKTVDEVKDSATEVKEVIDKVAQTEDKSALLLSLVKVAGNEIFEVFKGAVAGELARAFMIKHFEQSDEITCDKYLKQLGVVNGLNGLNLSNSAIYVNGTEDIKLICKYDLSIIKLLDRDISFRIVQTAYTKAWGAQALVGGGDDEEADAADAASSKFVVVGEGEGAEFGEYAAKAKPLSGYVDVIIHASADGEMQVMHNGKWQPITTKNLKKLLQGRGYNGENIRIISCGAGSKTSTIAQSIADSFKVNVVAPTDTVWAYPDGKLVIGPDASTNSGEWKEFKPYNAKEK